MDNLASVLHQMEAFGIVLKDKDLSWISSLNSATEGKKRTIGAKGKDWAKLYLFRPDRGGVFITGSFGTYRHGGSWEKVDTEFVKVTAAERERQKREREAAAARAAEARAKAHEAAHLSAHDLWLRGSPTGSSPYLEKKGVEGESCRYLAEPLTLFWPGRERGEKDVRVKLPAGTLLVPLVRYDLPRAEALRGLQFIRPDGAKIYMRGFEKVGASLRLGEGEPHSRMVLLVEGYATGLSVRAALKREFPVYVAFDAGNLRPVAEILLDLYEHARILICADDDWQTRDKRTGQLNNPGRTVARAIAMNYHGVDFVYPIFDRFRPLEATDYDDLRQHQGLDAVARQIRTTVGMIQKRYG